jgi:hypothetical protein
MREKQELGQFISQKKTFPRFFDRVLEFVTIGAKNLTLATINFN